MRRGLLLGWIALFGACAGRAQTGPLSPAALMAHVRFLADPSLDGRQAGTAGERAAVAYVEEQLRGDGLTPEEQPVPWEGGGSTNVYAMIEGKSDEVVVIGAHLDHLGRRGGKLYPGADDNASGVALVLGVASTLAARGDELGRSVLIVFFGAEEPGLVGSRYFVEHPPIELARVVAMVNVDMIGRPLLDQRWARLPLHLFGIPRDRAAGLLGTRHHPGLRALADRAFAGEGELVAPEDLPATIDGVIEAIAEGRSDSTPFEEHGIPALFFGDAQSRDYHRPSDTIGRLHPGLLAQNARGVARVVVALSNAPASAFVRSDASPRRRNPRRGWYLPFGVSAGYASGHRAIYGGELSLVHLWSGSLRYAGVYVDAVRVPATGSTRISVGPEVGKGWFGADAGYLIEIEGGEVAHRGVIGRVFTTAALFSFGVRAGYLVDDGAFAEIDLLLKYPLHLF